MISCRPLKYTCDSCIYTDIRNTSLKCKIAGIELPINTVINLIERFGIDYNSLDDIGSEPINCDCGIIKNSAVVVFRNYAIVSNISGAKLFKTNHPSLVFKIVDNMLQIGSIETVNSILQMGGMENESYFIPHVNLKIKYNLDLEEHNLRRKY